MISFIDLKKQYYTLQGEIQQVIAEVLESSQYVLGHKVKEFKKNFGAYGDAGVVVIDDEELAKRLQELRNHGSLEKYYHPQKGVNSRLDEIHTVVSNFKLKYLDKWNNKRQQHAFQYDKLLTNIVTPTILKQNTSNFHLYAIRSAY